MKVVLKRDWFGPDGKLYEANASAIDMPDKYKGDLPSDAKVVSKSDYAPEVVGHVPTSLAEIDPERAATDTSTAFKGKRAK